MPANKSASRTDWAKVDATTDEDIARQITEDPDTAPEWTDEDFANAEVWHGNKFLGHGRDFKNGRKIGRPKGSGTKEMVTLRLDHAILDHFRAGGPGWQTRLNDVLLASVKSRSSRVKGAQIIGGLVSVEALKVPPRGTNARLIVEVLKAMPRGGTTSEIRTVLQNEGVPLAFTSIRRSLGRLKERKQVTASDDGKTWSLTTAGSA